VPRITAVAHGTNAFPNVSDTDFGKGPGYEGICRETPRHAGSDRLPAGAKRVAAVFSRTAAGVKHMRSELLV